MELETTNICRNVEAKVNHDSLCTRNKIEVDIQIAYLNMLYEQGILTEGIYSNALSKIKKGVI